MALLRRLALLALTTVVAACASQSVARGPSDGVSPEGRPAPNAKHDSLVVHASAGELGPTRAAHDSIAVSLRDVMSGSLSIFCDTIQSGAAMQAPAII